MLMLEIINGLFCKDLLRFQAGDITLRKDMYRRISRFRRERGIWKGKYNAEHVQAAEISTRSQINQTRHVALLKHNIF